MKSSFVAAAVLAMLLGVVNVVMAQGITEKSGETESLNVQTCPFYGLGLGPRDGTGRGPGHGMGLGPRDGTGRGPGYGMGLGPQNGMGRGPGYGMGRGTGFRCGAGWGAAQGRPGMGFLDDDGDGLCDRFQANLEEE